MKWSGQFYIIHYCKTLEVKPVPDGKMALGRTAAPNTPGGLIHFALFNGRDIGRMNWEGRKIFRADLMKRKLHTSEPLEGTCPYMSVFG